MSDLCATLHSKLMGILKIISFENSAKLTNTLCLGALDPSPEYPSKSGLTVAANIYFKIVFSHPADTCHPVLLVLQGSESIGFYWLCHHHHTIVRLYILNCYAYYALNGAPRASKCWLSAEILYKLEINLNKQKGRQSNPI